MSLTGNDRNFQSNGGRNVRPGPVGGAAPAFVSAIADALRADFGSMPSTMKTVARMTGANERTVRNWFEEKNGPSGEHLVVLMQNSEAVLQTVLRLSGREELLAAAGMARARAQLRETLGELDRLLSGHGPADQ
jgi:pyocin large subunit-like protein